MFSTPPLNSWGVKASSTSPSPVVPVVIVSNKEVAETAEVAGAPPSILGLLVGRTEFPNASGLDARLMRLYPAKRMTKTVITINSIFFM